MVIEALLGVITGGAGSWISKVIGIFEKRQDNQHEITLLEMQMRARQSETENELAIAQEEAFSTMRQASYEHDVAAGKTSRWVNNTLRMVRPALTLLLILLVWIIWMTMAKDNIGLQVQIIDGVLFMASAALAWWFGDRAPSSKKLPWQ